MTEWHPLRSLDNKEEEDAEAKAAWNALDTIAEENGRRMMLGGADAGRAAATMPSLHHATMSDYHTVYEPSDDTYLLLDALKYDLFSEAYNDGHHEQKAGTARTGGGGIMDEDDIYVEGMARTWYDQLRSSSSSSSSSSSTSSSHRNNNNIDGNDEDNVRIVQNLLEDGEVGSNPTTRSTAMIDQRIRTRLQQLHRLEEIHTVMEIGTGNGIPITYLTKQLRIEKPPNNAPVGGCPPPPPNTQHHSNTPSTTTTATATDTATPTRNTTHHKKQRQPQQGITMIATDLNPAALEFAKKTAAENGLVMVREDVVDHNTKNTSDNETDTDDTIITPALTPLDTIHFRVCDLATPLLPEFAETVDVLLFNPPYVPTEETEIRGQGIEISYAGGINGRQVIDRALPQIAQLLTPKTKKQNNIHNNNVHEDASDRNSTTTTGGVCYMITVDDNNPSEIATLLQNDYGLCMIPLIRRRARNEYLSVQKIYYP